MNSELVVVQLIVLFTAIGLHEYAHCKFADMAGDPTPGFNGRVTLNLFKHFDPFGAMMIVFTTLSGFGIGWGKPAPMNPAKMNDPKWDFFIAVIAGPLSNILQAVAWALLGMIGVRTGLLPPDSILLAYTGQSTDFGGQLVLMGVYINLALALFNLIPLGPLDGHWLVGILLPDPYDIRWYRFQRHYGTAILIAVILLGQFSRSSGSEQLNLLGHYIFPLAERGARFLLGIHI